MIRPRFAIALVLCTGCLSASSNPRSYYTLHGVLDGTSKRGSIPGLLRVRDLDAAKAYDKFQIVVRRSPFELRYAETHVWAVKPHRMMSDLIAQWLADTNTFEAVTRELGVTRPKFVLDGDLQAVEIYDSGEDLWFGHLALSLRLTRFSTGEVLWSYTFDERKEVQTRTFSHAVRTISELMIAAIDEAIQSMDPLRPPGPARSATSVPIPQTTTSTAPHLYDPKSPVYVPDKKLQGGE